MPHYYFHLAIGPVFIRDRQGTELPDDDTAREHARDEILAVSKARVIKGQNPAFCPMEVEGDQRGAIFRVPLREAAEV